LPWRGLLVTLAIGHFLVPLPLMAAGPKGKVVVLQAQSDELGADDRSAATTVLRDAVKKYPDVTLLPTPTGDLLDIMIELECVDYDAECLSKMGKKWGADHLLFTQIAESGGYSVTLVAVDVGKGTIAKTQKASVSSKAGLSDKLSELVYAALGKPPADKPIEPAKPTLTVVTVKASQDGATVFLNDTKAGVSPLTVKLKPGGYRVRIVAEGFQDATDRLVVKAGKSQSMHLDLKPVMVAKPQIPEDEDEAGTPVHKQWWFWTIIGAVVVGGAVATAVVLTQDDDPAATGTVRFGFGNADQDPLVRASR
jgi:hypothetical protein